VNADYHKEGDVIMTKWLATSAAALLLAAGPALAQQTTLNIGMASADVGRLDPHNATTTPDKGVLHYIFSGLVRVKPGEASPEFIEPDIAESWESSEDGLTWTFQIREGVQCHGDYGELTAEDVVWSLERARDPERSSFANDYAAVDTITATGENEVEIVLSRPVPSLLGLYVNYHGGNIVCREAVEALGEDFNLNPVGTGPFMFAEYQPQQYVRLVANEDYFRGAPFHPMRAATSPSSPASST
jgi:peptide/nickel transport system substrate-binding protein